MTKDDALARAAFALAHYTVSTRKLAGRTDNTIEVNARIERENREAAQALGVLTDYEADIEILT